MPVSIARLIATQFRPFTGDDGDFVKMHNESAKSTYTV